jgi:hypothetical protein
LRSRELANDDGPPSSDETIEINANDERRMCGLAGDDDEDDLCEDAAELFGHSVEAPIDVDGDDPEGGGGAKKKRTRTTPSAHVPRPR